MARNILVIYCFVNDYTLYCCYNTVSLQVLYIIIVQGKQVFLFLADHMLGVLLALIK